MITPRSYAKKLAKAEKSADERLRAYLKKGDEENVHDLRTSIRRVIVTGDLLPRQFRKKKRSRRYLKDHDKLLKLNAKVRDLDVVLSKMGVANQKQRDDLVEKLEATRRSMLKKAQDYASSIKGQRGFSIRANDLSVSDLRRRFKKNAGKLARRIERRLSTVLGDPANTEELHKLREDSRTLRYTLELDESNPTMSSLVSTLESWQTILGEIHDSDIFIMHIEEVAKKANGRGGIPPEMKEALEREILSRKQNYEKFSTVAKEGPGFDLLTRS